jgi:hypothetical protein
MGAQHAAQLQRKKEERPGKSAGLFHFQPMLGGLETNSC